MTVGRRSFGSLPLRLLACFTGLLMNAGLVRASSFDVYCTNNADGTLTCLGWDGGETLTCVSSRGNTTTCSTPSGRSFSCVRGLAGVLSCSNPANRSGRGDGPSCVPAGDGTLVCDEEDPPTEPLLPRPGIPRSTDSLNRPLLEPLRPGSLSLPSVFD
jgi:hypothetical protein